MISAINIADVTLCNKCGYPHGAEKIWAVSTNPIKFRGCANQSEPPAKEQDTPPKYIDREKH